MHPVKLGRAMIFNQDKPCWVQNGFCYGTFNIELLLTSMRTEMEASFQHEVFLLFLSNAIESSHFVLFVNWNQASRLELCLLAAKKKLNKL